MRVLILGGTAEARALAEHLVGRPDVDVVSSLAGRVADPRRPPGAVRIGGFDGVDGLAAYVSGTHVGVVVDATHPFAARMTEHAVEACRRVGVPLLAIRRPGWAAGPGDAWWRVPDVAAAAARVAAAPPGVVLLTIGRRGLAAFADDDRHHFVIRSVDPPDDATPLPARHSIVRARGPFAPDDERALFTARGVTLLVAKDSGGDATAAKLVAARELGVPVVLVDRPPVPPGLVVLSPDEARRRLATLSTG